MESKKLEELEETILRLHVYLKRMQETHKFEGITSKIQNGKHGFWNKRDKVLVSEYLEYKFYEGKMMAYMTALAYMNELEVVMLVERLRGFELDITKNKVYQTKHVNSLEEKGP